jgi:hypothetical protein
VLETDRPLGDTGHRELAGDRARGDHDEVVAQFERVAVGWPDRDHAVLVVDRADHASDDARAVQMATQRHRGVPGLDRPGHHLGQERLVGHVWPRVDHRHFGLAPTQLLSSFHAV